MEVRSATLSDLGVLVYTESLNFTHDIFNENHFKYYILHKDNIAKICIFDSISVGYYLLKFSKNKNIAFLDKLSVLPWFQNRKIGMFLLNDIEKKCREFNIPRIRLRISTSNIKGVDFYKKYNYNIINALLEIYENKSNAYTMEKIIEY